MLASNINLPYTIDSENIQKRHFGISLVLSASISCSNIHAIMLNIKELWIGFFWCCYGRVWMKYFIATLDLEGADGMPLFMTQYCWVGLDAVVDQGEGAACNRAFLSEIAVIRKSVL